MELQFYPHAFYMVMQELCDEVKWDVKYDEKTNTTTYYPVYKK